MVWLLCIMCWRCARQDNGASTRNRAEQALPRLTSLLLPDETASKKQTLELAAGACMKIVLVGTLAQSSH